MNQVFAWIRLALPFAELAYATALLINPGAAADIRIAIDALKRAIETSAEGAAVARGMDGIQRYGDRVIAALDALKIAVLDKAEKAKQANDLWQSLFDATKVYQPKRGADKDLLDKFKANAEKKAKEINN